MNIDRCDSCGYLHFGDCPDYEAEARQLRAETEMLRKWFAYLVDFIHADQCRPDHGLEGPPEKCWCCSDYLEVANHAATQAGVLPGREERG